MLNHIGPVAFALALMTPHKNNNNIHIDGHFLSQGTSVGNSKSIFYDRNTFSTLRTDEKGARSIFMTFVQQSKLTGTVRFLWVTSA